MHVYLLIHYFDICFKMSLASVATSYFLYKLTTIVAQHVIQGASAAVNAIILLDVFLFPKNIYYVNLIIPVPAMLMVRSDSLSGDIL